MKNLTFLHETLSGFTGNIKTVTSDFKVWEIGQSGTPCGEQSNDKLQEKEITNETNEISNDLQTSSPKPICNKNLKVSTLTDVETVFECDESWCHKHLLQKLNESFTLLHFYAAQVLDDTKHSESLKLGIFDNKSERTNLHKCIHFLYPQLCSETLEKVNIIVKPCQVFAAFKDLLGQEEASSFLQFTFVTGREGKTEYNITGNFNKATRRLIHFAIDKHFGRLFVAKTKPHIKNPSETRIEVRLRPKNLQAKNYKQTQFCKFVLHKENIETLEAIHQLSKCFNLRPHNFSYAGLKDKKAETWQYLTVEGINTASVKKLSTNLPNNLRVHDVTHTSSHIQRGQLAGNRFAITIRNVREQSSERSEKVASDATMSDELYSQQLRQIIRDSLSHIENKGFINYFGPQRFGRQLNDAIDQLENATYEASSVGLAILKGDFRTAVNILLQPNDRTHPSEKLSKVDEAKRLFQETGNIEETLAMMPKHKTREVALLRALRRFHSDVTKQNRKRRHEDSSNTNLIGVTSSDKGNNGQCVAIAVGDVGTDDVNAQKVSGGSMTSSVDDATHQDAYMKALLSLPHTAIMLYVHAYCSHVWNHVADDRVRRYGYRVVEGDLVQSAAGDLSRDQIHIVTPHDVANELFTPRDIVLPLPGSKVTYPPNLAETYLNLLGADGIDASSKGGAFNVNQLKVRVPGTNRKLFEFPRYVSFNLKRSDDEIQVDTADDITHDLGSNPGQGGCDVQVKFDLSSSCYATSVLRELSHGGVANW